MEELPLSKEVKAYLKEKGVKRLYPPQVKAVEKGLLDGKSLVVSAPTASGKTLMAELAILKKLPEEGCKALYLTPLRALAAEKYLEFKDLSKLGLKVALTTGDYDSSDPWLSDYDVIVTTNEKADSLLRHRADWVKDIGIVIADEIHLVNEPKRGPTLEMVLAKLLRYLRGLQVIALSATIRNASEIARWLGADLIVSDWRPVPLKEGVLYGGKVYYGDGTVKEVGDLPTLIKETILEGGQVLVFTGTRQRAVKLAGRMGVELRKVLGPKERLRLEELAREMLAMERNSVVEELAKCVRYGVAFHHAGLTHKIRSKIEEGFRGNILKVVTATPTLAAGVNLPARRVVIYDYRRYNPELGVYEEIPIMEYKQMCLPYDERVALANGESVEIGRLVEGLKKDPVLSYDLRKGVLEPSHISTFYKSKAYRLYVLSVEGGREVRLTGNHEVLILRGNCRRWVQARTVRPGCEVLVLEGGSLSRRRVVKVEVEERPEGVTVYNLGLARINNYFANDILVHNCGRAGRPQYDEAGEAFIMARREWEVEDLLDGYVNAPPEPVTSKLSSEPSLRSHVLALISTEGPLRLEDLVDFMSRTFYAVQYPLRAIRVNVMRVASFLKRNSFIEEEGGVLRATYLGRRVSELYIDPLTAVTLVKGLKSKPEATEVGYLHLISFTSELPSLYLRRGEEEAVSKELSRHVNELLIPPPEDEYEYEIYLAKFKTALLLRDWIEEVPEDSIIRKYDVGPGDIYAIVQASEWLLYSAYEICKALGLYDHLMPLLKLRERVKEGVKEELLELTRIKGIGRVRARILYNYGYRSLEDLRGARLEALASLPSIGLELAKRIKEYVEKGGEGAIEIRGAQVETTLDEYF